MFGNYIKKIVDKKHFFFIHSTIDLEFFILGCLCAKKIYSRIDEELESINLFRDFVLEHYGLSRKSNRSWGEIIWFYSEDEKSSIRKFLDLFHDFLGSISCLNSTSESIHWNSVSTAGNFIGFLPVIKENYEKMGIKSIDNFSNFYLGYFAFGDYDKGDAFFAPLNDTTFIDFYSNGGFKEFVRTELDLNRSSFYFKMIKYAAANNYESSMDLLFRLVNKYLRQMDIFDK